MTLPSVVGCTAFSAPRYRGPRSPHFDGSAFRNPDGREIDGARVLGWLLRRDPGPFREWVDDPPGPKPPERVDGGRIRVTLIGHSTLLVQMDGKNILTDPVYSNRVGPLSWVGPRRRRPPGIRFEDLPKIDAVVVSHNHYDHMDVPTLARLSRAHAPRIVCGLGNDKLLRKEWIAGGEAIDWWQSVDLGGGVRITGVPTHHGSMRGLFDRNATLWLGFVIEGPSGAVYFAGDTGWGEHFNAIGRRFRNIRAALLPIGAYRPREVLSPVHIAPDEAVWASIALGAQTSIAMHYGTFPQADDGEFEPIVDLERALASTPSPPRFWVLGFGEGRDVP
jgi:L-ascorbate metabolism protein UlaG (beta-lactamase superfamily)